MIIQRKTNGQLHTMVDILWFVDETDLAEERRTDTITPSGHIHVVFNFGDPCFIVEGGILKKMPNTVLVGQLKKAMNVRYGANVKQLGLAFHPYSFYQLFHEVGSIYAEAMIDISELDALSALTDTVKTIVSNEANNGKEILDAISDYFLSDYQVNDIPVYLDRVQALIENNEGMPTIDEMAQVSGYSVSGFERNFKRHMGLSPKAYTDIMRFRHAVVDKDPERLFYDQSHYIKNFKKYTGKVPSGIAASEEISLLHMLGLKEDEDADFLQ